MNKEIKFEKIKVLGKISDFENSKEVSIIKWGDSKPKIDIRTWYKKDGKELPGKGITLSEDEAIVMIDIIEKYFEGK